MSEDKRKAACWCGEVELEITGAPAAQVYCHCGSCRGWLSAPLHAATLWPTPNVNVVKGADKIGVIKKTDMSHRHFCRSCGAGVFVRHPPFAMTDVPAGRIADFTFDPTIHVHYAARVLPVRDGLPKFKDFPKDFGGSGDLVDE